MILLQGNHKWGTKTWVLWWRTSSPLIEMNHGNLSQLRHRAEESQTWRRIGNCTSKDSSIKIIHNAWEESLGIYYNNTQEWEHRLISISQLLSQPVWITNLDLMGMVIWSRFHRKNRQRILYPWRIGEMWEMGCQFTWVCWGRWIWMLLLGISFRWVQSVHWDLSMGIVLKANLESKQSSICKLKGNLQVQRISRKCQNILIIRTVINPPSARKRSPLISNPPWTPTTNPTKAQILMKPTPNNIPSLQVTWISTTSNLRAISRTSVRRDTNLNKDWTNLNNKAQRILCQWILFEWRRTRSNSMLSTQRDQDRKSHLERAVHLYALRSLNVMGR